MRLVIQRVTSASVEVPVEENISVKELAGNAEESEAIAKEAEGQEKLAQNAEESEAIAKEAGGQEKLAQNMEKSEAVAKEAEGQEIFVTAGNHRIAGSIGHGLLVLLGVGRNDTEQTADLYVDKLLKLRIFADADGKTNRSLADVSGELLVISQFTLYADCRHGNRPSFTGAGDAREAERLYEYFVKRCREHVDKVETGVFGADMKVSLVNDGPFTIVLDEDLAEKGKR